MTYSFGPFRYDAAQRLLFRSGELMPLAPKTLETLHVLLERRGSMVEKSELMKLVWPDTNVEEVGLARNISMLRKALGDDSAASPYIETIPRRGYRFAAATTTDPSVTPGPGSAPSSLRWLWLAAPVCAIVAGLVYYQFYVPSRYLPGAVRGASLAVVPFECIGGEDTANFSEEFSEALVVDLAKLGGMQVLSPSTVRRHRRAGISTGLMGRLLGLDVLVEGTVRRLEAELQITARLVDVHTGRLIWAETYEAPADGAAAEETVAPAMAAEIGKRLAGHAAR